VSQKLPSLDIFNIAWQERLTDGNRYSIADV